jgi:hypothetical protein
MSTSARHLWVLFCVLAFALVALVPWWPAWS